MRSPASPIGRQGYAACSGPVQRAAALLALLVLMLWSATAQADPAATHTESIKLQLKWRHAFQFAGYYAALDQGYYREAGLDVEILEASPGLHPVTEVVEDRAEYGVGDSSLLLARLAGAPVVVLNVIFQHSAIVLVALDRDPEQSVHSLRGKRIMLVPGDSELRAYLQDEGLPPGTYQEIPNSFVIDDLLEGKTDAFSAYITDQTYTLERRGVQYSTYSPRSAGIDFYGDNLFTTEKEIRDHPGRVEKFRNASLKGWAYAMANPEPVIQLILEKYSQDRDADSLAYEARQMIGLIQPEFVAMGYMHQGRWEHIAQVYADIGMLDHDVSLAGFLYKDRPTIARRLDYRVIALALAGLLVVAFVALRFYRLSQSLRRDILAREKAEKEKAAMELRLLQGQKMEAIGNLAGGVAHDINNVLAVVLGLGSVLQSQMAADDPGREDMADILAATRRGQTMVQNLLGFARKGDYAKTRWSPNDAIENMAGLLSKMITKTIVITTDLKSSYDVFGDRHQFETVLVNLCVNASQAIKEKGTIEISTSDYTPASEGGALATGGNYVRVQVRDSGAGMDADMIEHAFEPFFTTKDVGVGTGLGLSMVQGVVENHGGTVSLTSKLGVGTMVTLLFPSAVEGNLPCKPSAPVAAEQRGVGTILVVDDEALVRRSVQRMLERSGYDVMTADSGQSALKLFREEHQDIDLVLLDLSMPKMSGRMCFDELKAIQSSVQVLISTGHGSPADTAEMLTKGALGVLTKPYSMLELVGALNMHLHPASERKAADKNAEF